MGKPRNVSLEDAVFDAEVAATVDKAAPTLGTYSEGKSAEDIALRATDLEGIIEAARMEREAGNHDEADRLTKMAQDAESTGDPATDARLLNLLHTIPARPVDTIERPKPKRRTRKAAATTGPSVDDAFASGARLDLPAGDALPGGDEPKARARRSPAMSGSARSSNPGSDQLTDLFASGMILLISFSLGDEFLPTPDEANALARPVGNMLARRIDLAAKLGEDAGDVVSFAIAVMSYGSRVAPIAANKVGTWNAERARRTRVGRVVPDPRGNANDDAPGSVAAREDVRERPASSAPYDPFAALAQVAGNGRNIVARDLGSPLIPRPAVGTDG